MVKKTAPKKTTYVDPPPKFKKDFKEVENTLKKLKLNLEKMSDELDALCQNPQIPVPSPPKK